MSFFRVGDEIINTRIIDTARFIPCETEADVVALELTLSDGSTRTLEGEPARDLWIALNMPSKGPA